MCRAPINPNLRQQSAPRPFTLQITSYLRTLLNNEKSRNLYVMLFRKIATKAFHPNCLDNQDKTKVCKTPFTISNNESIHLLCPCQLQMDSLKKEWLWNNSNCPHPVVIITDPSPSHPTFQSNYKWKDKVTIEKWHLEGFQWKKKSSIIKHFRSGT